MVASASTSGVWLAAFETLLDFCALPIPVYVCTSSTCWVEDVFFVPLGPLFPRLALLPFGLAEAVFVVAERK